MFVFGSDEADCEAGNVIPVPSICVTPGIYDAYVNPQGAVSIKIGGEFLGIKPGEFEWVEK